MPGRCIEGANMRTERYLANENSGRRLPLMAGFRFVLLLWVLLCLGLWLLVARDVATAILCLVLTVAPTAYFIYGLRRLNLKL